ncbi:MAG: sigma-70 family RNA polymerase sigma factor [Bacteroidetes bacterium]|nr:sigma-70 family RNA polymerase sigma factor [Bacteroidota bacterium]
METKEKSLLFQELIEQNKGILYKVARTYCQNENERQDLIQEMMIQAWQSFHKYNSEFKISTWLYRISINVAISYYRKNAIKINRNVPLTEDVTQIKEDEKAEKELQLSMLDQFISELKELDKALILLYLEDKSHNEIAEILGITVGNVGTKIGRIKDNLKQRFSQQNIY